MKARIFKPSKTAVQSGKFALRGWLLEYEPEIPKAIEPLMGWTASADMRRQIRLQFDTKKEAIAYAERNSIPYEVLPEPEQARHIAKSYSDNFKVSRKQMWTH